MLHNPFRIALLLAAAIPLVGSAQIAHNLAQTPDRGKPLLTVVTTCGECQLDLPGEGCDVAIRVPMKGGATKDMYVDGVAIMEYGDPHEENGFCLAMRKAEVQGDVVDGRFKATYFKLLPPEKERHKH